MISKRAGTIAVKDYELYKEYDVRAFMNYKTLLDLGNKFRVVDLDGFETNGATYYSAVIVPNTGKNYKNCGWLSGSAKSDGFPLR